MYLKRIESVGFKSFADRISIQFVKGITAVIGPNGSGKSNVTDAIRWVLGEQSIKSLRGSKMEDVIFQGSDTRKPLNVAEVTLVLDNSSQVLPLDYNEVSITRRVYRSGASEFYINKQSCRLKDIIDLFMDSGLGQEAFSIISQGKVEEVLRSKAEERRTIFEEAAGVLKYKHRKKKSEYKLAETQENLNRIDDIIYELEQQKKPLSKQAEVAKRYNKQKKLLKNQEISLLITEIEDLHEKWQVSYKDVEEEKLTEIEMKTAIQTKDIQLEVERKKVIEIDKSIEELQEKLVAKTRQVEQYEGKRHVLNERLKHFTENKKQLKEKKMMTEQKVNQLQVELTEGKRVLKQLQESQLETNERIEQLKNSLESVKNHVTKEIEQQKTAYIEHLNEQAAKQNEKHSIDQQVKQLAVKQGKHTNEFSQLLATKKELLEDQTKQESLLSQKEKEQTKQQARMLELKSSVVKKRNHVEAMQQNLYKGYETIAKLKSRKDMLEEMKEGFQGFYYGVKRILQARENNLLPNIHGAVIELIDIPKMYLTTMETVLGGQAQNIVVDDEKTAREVISWLKNTNNGRATFLPLSTIQRRFIPNALREKVKQHPGFIGIAADLVNTKPTFRKAVEHLMGHIIVAKTLQDANDIAKVCGYKNRIVTLDGDVVSPGGSMSGGAKQKQNQSLFTREKDLDEAIKALASYKSKAKTFEREIEEERQVLEKTEAMIEESEQTLSISQEQWQEIKTNSKQIEIRLSTIQDQISSYDQDEDELILDQESLQTRNNKLTNDLNQLAEMIKDIQTSIEHLTKQEISSKENQDQLSQKLHRLQILKAEQDERIRNQSEKVRMTAKELQEQSNQFDQHTNELSDLLQARQAEETEESVESHLSNERVALREIEEEIQQKRSSRLKETELISDQERELKEENKAYSRFMKVIQEKEVKVNRIDVELENRLTHLQTEYTISFEKARSIYERVPNVSEAHERVQQLTKEISKLGTVNLGAIDEYDRILERYTFLTEQKDDLVEAKENLFAIIAEMDKVMTERFEHTFLQIKEEFGVVFKELFGGGVADLKLTDPNNMLDTGIDIIAQPPGKRLQHIGLLSGGERALTAIALLFAILRIRPVPFCVLDEVEAALDEANVVRFAKYLKLHSEDTQFIVITHRKGTMEEADVLYGITMQEAGVSRLVSVQLEETEKLVNA